MAEVKIGNSMVGDGHRVYVIAEIGINHNGDLELAKQLIEAGEIAQNIKGGLPFKPEAEALSKARRAANGKDNPEAACLPMGILQFHTQGAPRKLIQTPDVLVILYEASMGVRQIFTDGRKIPADDPQPWWYGYSVGRWEGDTLVVETAQYVVNQWLERFGETGVGAISTPDPKDLNATWELNTEFVLDPLANVPGPSALIIPVGLAPGELRDLLTERPLNDRRFEATCGSLYFLEETELQFPKSVKIERVPRAVTFHEPGLRYASQYVLKGKTLQVKREFWLQRERAVCDAK